MDGPPQARPGFYTGRNALGSVGECRNKPRQLAASVQFRGGAARVPTGDDGTVDNFVHISALKRAGLTTLLEGQKIEYELVEDRHGQVSADNLKLVQ